MHLTFPARIDDETCHPALVVMAGIDSAVQRKLHAALAAGKYNDGPYKRGIEEEFNLTSRQFNAMANQAKGKIKATTESLNDNIVTTKAKQNQLVKQVAELEKAITTGLDKKGRRVGKAKKTRYLFAIHGKNRKITRCEHKIIDMEARVAAPDPGICFGTRKLFLDQFKPGSDHTAWLERWHTARNAQFRLVGAIDEPTGCGSCQSVMEDDGTVTLRLRPFNSMLAPRPVTGKPAETMNRRKTITVKANDYIEIRGLAFHHGHAFIRDVMHRNQGKDKKRRTPLTWRFVNQDGTWYVHLTFDITDKTTFDGSKGAIGLDCNQDHIAATVVDQHGNFVACRRFDLMVYGASSDRAADLIGCTAKDVVAWATELGLPIVTEALDFKKKKLDMTDLSGKWKRQVSSFHYAAWGQALRSRCLRFGVAFAAVDPSYTSLIGHVKYAASMGLSVHHAAALVIARRGLCLSERIPRSAIRVADGKGHHVTLCPAVSMGSRHVWCSAWWGMPKAVKAAHAALLSEFRLRQLECLAALKSRVIAGKPEAWGIDGGIPSRSPDFRSLGGMP